MVLRYTLHFHLLHRSCNYLACLKARTANSTQFNWSIIIWNKTPSLLQLWPWRTPAPCCRHWAATTLVIMAITLTITGGNHHLSSHKTIHMLHISGCLQAPTLQVLQTMSTMALALDMLLIQDMSQLIVLNQTHSQLFLSIE